MAIEFAAPRRYFVNGCGERILVGLSVEETSEFEQLDTPSHEGGDQGLAADTKGMPKLREQRWLELYHKHNDAWHSSLIRQSARQFPLASSDVSPDHSAAPGFYSRDGN
ncbi:MAG: hypothetical protein HZA66_03465 [Rhodopseudomonas palustris]|uniref:Uncharacterized protein n=1 Tax=Rhodopseudomonas palustris TaxID=1076 RepID=A0A933RXV4_RHOPL|nr:hypothetical protein [Rhodopseudomonas palustris]